MRQWPIDAARLAQAAPRLIDTTARETLLEAVRSLPVEQIASRAGLAYTVGYAALVDGNQDAGIGWLARARAALRPSDWLLEARIAFEIGAAYLTRGLASPADVLLLDAQGDGTRVSADRVHLQALADEAAGDYRRATANYRRVLQGDMPVLSQATRVLAMINLAAALNQHDPAESLALSEFALATITAHGFHRRLRPPALNVMGYAQICVGRFAAARTTLKQAAAEARVSGYTRVELYAEFNQAILDELSGAPFDAARRLVRLRDRCANVHTDVAGWAAIRLAWLSWINGETDGAASGLPRDHPTWRSARYADALRCLVAFDDSRRGRTAQAIAEFSGCVRSAESRGDSASAFALLLQLAHLEHAEGRAASARKRIDRALEILEASTFRLSPNWWSADAFRTLLKVADHPSIAELVPPPLLQGRVAGRRDVEVYLDGTVMLDGAEFFLLWATGRTGRHMLLRFFTELLLSYPQPLARDLLADRLWPESEGDAAVRNLYAATNDLRKILVDVPGVRVRVDAGHYRLIFDPNVHLYESHRPATN